MPFFNTDESSEDSFTLTGSQSSHLDPNNFLLLNQTTTVQAFTAAEFSGVQIWALDFNNAQNFLNHAGFQGFPLTPGGQFGLQNVTLPAGQWFIGVFDNSLSGNQVVHGFDEISTVALDGGVFVGNIPLGVGGPAGSWRAQSFTVTGSPDIFIETEGSGGTFMVQSPQQFAAFQAAFPNGFTGGSFSFLNILGGPSDDGTELEGTANLPAGQYVLTWVNTTGAWAGGAADLSAFASQSGGGLSGGGSSSNGSGSPGTGGGTPFPPAPLPPAPLPPAPPPPPAVNPLEAALIDSSFYKSTYPDIARAGLDPIQHFTQTGWKEGRNPDAFFDTNFYLSHNPDVAAAHVDPLLQYATFGWKEGRNPSASFNTNAYLAANPDVKAAGIDPLQHYLQTGINEHRALTPTAPTGGSVPPATVNPLEQALISSSFYLGQYGDIAAAHLDPVQHFAQSGWKEMRNPDPFFNTQFYLAQNPDVSAANVDPLLQYATVGWKEGRNPSLAFNTNAYLAANPDVKAAGIDPLQHYLQTGQAEHRSLGFTTLTAGAGSSILTAGATGNWALIGGNGNDTLIGSGGNDTMVGGAGSDLFVIGSATRKTTGGETDLIIDFQPGTDHVDLRAFHFASTLVFQSTITVFPHGNTVTVNLTQFGDSFTLVGTGTFSISDYLL